MLYSCSEVTKWIASDEYLTAGVLKRLGIRLQLIMCKMFCKPKSCFSYRKQLRALGKSLRATTNEMAVSESELETAKERVLEILSRKP